MSSNALGALAAATVTSGSAPAVGVSLDGAGTLAELAQQPTVERGVEAVREFLGIDVAFTGEFADGHQVFRVLRGDGDSFGVSQGFQIPLEQTYCQRVMVVALLHDIGKIAIPDAILHKKGALTDSEWKVMSTHPIKSAQLIDAGPGLSHLTRSIRVEHERWDGHGYPDGLVGENIPLPSRITLVCDAYHAMVSDRPYRKAMPVTQAREQIAAGAGSQFCPQMAHAFLHTTDPNLSPETTSAAGR
jgi:response regulator RpfG family c-di-GMP phosphodiesterase